jgi:hypothetical protein
MSPRELATKLPANIKFLASQITRKPSAFTSQWAATVEEAFSRYTRTSTVNFLLSVNDVLADFNWPFPGYVNLRRELAHGKEKAICSEGSMLAVVVEAVNQVLRGRGQEERARAFLDQAMADLFKRQAESVFQYWREHPLLIPKRPILGDLRRCYEEKLWAACLPTALPLLDLVMRAYFATDKLRVSVQTLWNAFEKAKILPKDLKPGFAVWHGSRDPDSGNAFAVTLEDDLRLPGVFLSSFVEFASRYYSWYKVTSDSPPDKLNRHAVMHCASEYWSEVYTTKLLTFLDLTLRLEKPLRILIHGLTEGSSHGQSFC